MQKATLAYLGVLGSKQRNEELKTELLERYDAEGALDFYGPIGLDIGAETPEEISIAILAEIINHTRGKRQPSLSQHYNISSLR